MYVEVASGTFEIVSDITEETIKGISVLMDAEPEATLDTTGVTATSEETDGIPMMAEVARYALLEATGSASEVLDEPAEAVSEETTDGTSVIIEYMLENATVATLEVIDEIMGVLSEEATRKTFVVIEGMLETTVELTGTIMEEALARSEEKTEGVSVIETTPDNVVGTEGEIKEEASVRSEGTGGGT